MNQLKVKRLTETAKLPTRGSAHAAGLDLYADEKASLTILGNAAFGITDWLVISTGISVAIPEGYVGKICPRSGLAVRNAIDVLAGVIDSDYRGEIKVVLINHGAKGVRINPGDRIAQLLIQPVEMLDPIEAELDDTDRGHSGFGSSGV